MISKIDTGNRFAVESISLARITLKGIGQIMLQDNALTGLLFLIGIFYSSIVMGFAALLATVCGTATALLLKYDKSEIEKGLYGFSAALVGVAVMVFLKPVFSSWILIVIGSVLATVLQHYFMKRKIPVFTLPFVMVTWLVLLFAHHYAIGILVAPTPVISSTIDYYTLGFKGYGQVIFQGSLISGLLFFIAVLINAPISALYGLVGAVVSAFIALKCAAPLHDISVGLFSFNAVLCAIVFAGRQIKDGIWVLISILLSLAISLLMVHFHISQLTFPFVLASCITLLLKNRLFIGSKGRLKHQ